MNYFIFPGLSSNAKIKELTIEERISQLKSIFFQKGYKKDFVSNRCREAWEYCYPRHVFRYILHRKENISSAYLERQGCGDHATILHSCKVVDSMIYSNNKEFLNKFMDFDL